MNMIKWALATAGVALMLSGCTISSDPERAKAALEALGFTNIAQERLLPGAYAKCPARFRTNYASCTSFQATAPWGKAVHGLVGCPSFGLCTVLVEVEK